MIATVHPPNEPKMEVPDKKDFSDVYYIDQIYGSEPSKKYKGKKC